MIKKIAVLICFTTVQGCAGLLSTPREDVPVEDATDVSSETTQIDSLDRALDDGLNNAGPGRPAVIALLDTAEQEREAGNMELAAASIERALRLEPKSALLWSRLAEIRLAQSNWQQAYVLANKSNSLVQSDAMLRIQNLRIIETAKTRQGDAAAAEQARQQIRALSE